MGQGSEKVPEAMFAVQVNVTPGRSSFPAGARAFVDRAYLGGNCGENYHIIVRSHSGRWIVKWERFNRLYTPRVKTIVPESPLYTVLGRDWMFLMDRTKADGLVQHFIEVASARDER